MVTVAGLDPCRLRRPDRSLLRRHIGHARLSRLAGSTGAAVLVDVRGAKAFRKSVATTRVHVVAERSTSAAAAVKPNLSDRVRLRGFAASARQTSHVRTLFSRNGHADSVAYTELARRASVRSASAASPLRRDRLCERRKSSVSCWSFDSRSASLRPANRLLRTFDMMGWLAMSEPGGSPKASCEASRMVRKRGLEPRWPCGH